MRSTFHLTITGLLALVSGALIFAFAAGGAVGAEDRGLYAVDTTSSQPVGLSPANGTALALPVDPLVLSWNPVPGATKYELEIAQNLSSTCTSGAAFNKSLVKISKTGESALTEPTYVPNLLDAENGLDLQDGSYCWHVRAIPNEDQIAANREQKEAVAKDKDAVIADPAPGLWSDTYSFTLDWTAQPQGLKFYNDNDGSIPRKPGEVGYGTGSTTSENGGYLSWDPLPGAIAYDVQTNKSPTFADGSRGPSVSRLATTALVLPRMSDDIYYWRVRAVLRSEGRGPWSETGTFEIKRRLDSWSDGTHISPDLNTNSRDTAVGWDPVRGASYYEVQAASNASCFWSPERGGTNPPTVLSGGTPSPINCRYSPASLFGQPDDPSITVNNWMDGDRLIDDTVLEDFRAQCPTGRLASCSVDLFDNDVLYWRVRPVWFVKPANDTLWDYSGPNADSGFPIYGSWLEEDRSLGYARPNRFTIQRDTTPTDSTNHARCADATNYTASGTGCLHMYDGSVSVSDPSVNTDTMQLPLLRWGAVPSQGQNHPGGHLVQIAHDPFFNDIVRQKCLGEKEDCSGATVFGVNLSYDIAEGLPDDKDGYWWRVIPCQSNMDSHCHNFYYENAPGLPSQFPSQPQTTARTFTKWVKLDMRTSPNFGGGSSPLIGVAKAGASSPEDWAAGVQGSEYYQFQLSRTRHFSALSDDTDDGAAGKDTIRSSNPFIEAQLRPDSKSTSALATGNWYWRARSVDHNGNTSSWSDTGSFVSTLPAPAVVSTPSSSGTGVTVRWQPVEGASYYEVLSSASPSFTDSTTQTATTAQLVHRAHVNGDASKIYWRVRAVTSAMELKEKEATTSKLEGEWSPVMSADVVAETRIRYEVRAAKNASAPTFKSGTTVTFGGQLVVGGEGINGRTVQLQRKTTSCDGPGNYVAVAQGKTAGDGSASIKAIVLQNACYRMAYVSSEGVLYSAPFAVGATPNVKLKTVSKKKIARGSKTCYTVTSTRPITGKVTFQTRNGSKGEFTPAGTSSVRNLKSKRMCFTIPKAGKQQVQLVFDSMTHPTQRWTQYEKAVFAGGVFTVNNVWVKKKKSRK